jgi:hypothetical protein
VGVHYVNISNRWVFIRWVFITRTDPTGGCSLFEHIQQVGVHHEKISTSR